MIKILNYGAGNMLSLYRAMDSINISYSVIVNAKGLSNKDILIIPGVGSFAKASEQLEKAGFLEFYNLAPSERPYIIGICLGMQLLLSEGEEGGLSRGLNLIPGKVVKINSLLNNDSKLYRTLIGWELFHLGSSISQSFSWLSEHSNHSYYHVHSYMCKLEDHIHLLASYPAALSFIPNIIGSIENRVIGFQFHPEKSAASGLRLLGDTITFAISQL